MADSRINAEYTFTDESGKKSTKNLTDLSPNASDSQIAALVEGLNSLTTNTLSAISRVETTDITNGGLAVAGYAFNNDGSADTDPAGVISIQTYSGKNYMVEFNVISTAGTNTVTDATFSGFKPKGSRIVVEDGGFVLRFSKDVTYSQGTGTYQMRITIAATDTYQSEDLYLYFFAAEEDMEAI